MTSVCANIRFEPIRAIGNDEGKNSQVFVARDLQLDTELFIKRISKKKLEEEGVDIEDYFLEARLLYASKHSHIAEIQYASEDEENIYLAMPVYENGSLSAMMDNRFLTVREIIKYSLDFLSGLAYIHSKGMIHLDIKPTNVLIDNTGKAILTDFGLSRFLDENGFAEQRFNYKWIVDPERIQSTNRAIESDIYQVGLLIYRMCNGNNILREQAVELGLMTPQDFSYAIINSKYPIRKKYLPHIPMKLQRIIEKCLNVDINTRYRNVIDIMNDLSNIEECLDWIYTPENKEVYTKIDRNFRISISIENKNNKYYIVCIKENLVGNTKRKMNDCCKMVTDKKDICKELKNIIKKIN